MKKLNDFILNIFASILISFVVQIIVYPFISTKISIQEYGEFLFFIAIANIVGVTLGNALNNTRLLEQRKYENYNLKGDFNIIFILAIFLIIITLPLLIFLSGIQKSVSIFLIACFILFKAYYSVEYRININYKKILFISILTFLGYTTGLLTYQLHNNYYLVFILGEFIPSVYLMFTSKIFREPLVKTKIFYKTLQTYTSLIITSIFLTLANYIDRLILLPYLGEEMVAVFFVASVLGKTVSVIMGPIAGVMLSYYVKEDSITLKSLYQKLFIFTLSSAIMLITLFIFGELILKILYPNIWSVSMEYFYISSLAAIIYILGGLIQPIMLRYIKMSFQIYIQGIYIFLIVFISGITLHDGGLMDFCIILLVLNLLRLISMILVTHLYIDKLNTQCKEN